MYIRWVSPWWPLTSAQWPWGPGRRDRSAPGERRARTAARWAGSAIGNNDSYLDNLSSGWQRRTSDIRGWWPAHSHRRCQLWIRMCRGMAWDCEKVFNVCILGGIVWCVRTNFLLQNLDWGKDDKPEILSLWCNRWCLSWLYSILLSMDLCFWHEEIFKWPLRHCFQYFACLLKNVAKYFETFVVDGSLEQSRGKLIIRKIRQICDQLEIQNILYLINLRYRTSYILSTWDTEHLCVRRALISSFGISYNWRSNSLEN